MEKILRRLTVDFRKAETPGNFCLTDKIIPLLIAEGFYGRMFQDFFQYSSSFKNLVDEVLAF